MTGSARSLSLGVHPGPHEVVATLGSARTLPSISAFLQRAGSSFR
jgi:hypothetical protein